MIVTPVAKLPSALRRSRESKASPPVLRTGAAWLPAKSSSILRPSEWRIGRQSERNPAVDCAANTPIQHVVGIGRVDVAECPLDWVSFIDGTPAARGEQQVNGLGTQGRGKCAVTPVAGALFYAGDHPGFGDPRRFVAILDCAPGDAKQNASDGEPEQTDRWQLIQRPRVELAASIGAALNPLDGEGPVSRNKHVGDLDIVAAGAGEADYLPRVDDRVVAGGHQEHARFVLPSLLVADDGAEHVPGGGIDPARKRPAAGQPVAAFHPPGAAARKNQGRADQAVGRLAPDFMLRF